jgi:hypothetical protein
MFDPLRILIHDISTYILPLDSSTLEGLLQSLTTLKVKVPPQVFRCVGFDFVMNGLSMRVARGLPRV